MTEQACDQERATRSSISSSVTSEGRTQTRRFIGEQGMAAFGGFSDDPHERAHFQCRIVSARHGRIDIGVVRFTPHSRFMPGDNFGHDHPTSRLVIVVDGAQTITVGQGRRTLTAGAGLLLPGDTSFSYRVDTVTTRLHVDLAGDDPEYGPLLDNVRWGYWPETSPTLAALSAFVRTLLSQGSARRARADRAGVQGTLEALVGAAISSAPPAEGLALRERAMRYIRAHHTDPALTPDAVAAEIGISVRTLQRAFFDGDSVREWITRLRVRHALDFLRDPQFATLTIPQIAQRSGFGSAAAMRRAVVAVTGLPPGTYRESRNPATDPQS